MSEPYVVKKISMIFTDRGESCEVKVVYDPPLPDAVDPLSLEQPSAILANYMLLAMASQESTTFESAEEAAKAPFKGMRSIK